MTQPAITEAAQRSMRSSMLCIVCCCMVSCGEQYAPPVALMPENREAVKQGLIKAGAKVTAEVPEGVYLSLRNSHVQILELGVTIESEPRVQKDILDFAKVTETVAGVFREADESEPFKKWLRTALAREASPIHHVEYKKFKVTLSRRPLRSTFTLVNPAEAEQPSDD
jgi:hypothetical protein